MAEQVVYVRASRADILQAIAAIPNAARGGGAAVTAMMVRLGLTALGHIRQAFIAKARGGTDEAGDRWKPLSPTTIAYSRRHRKKQGSPQQSRVFSRAKVKPWIPNSRGRAGYAPSYALTDKQNARWWQLYRQGLAMFKGDKGRAARRAWFISKAEGATTLMEQYGNAQVEILRDTGLLLNSLSPGVTGGDQVFRTGPGEVIVGTNRKWAGIHHHGSRNGRIPQRRLWPDPSRWPSSWWLDLLEQGRQGLVDVAMQLLGGL